MTSAEKTSIVVGVDDSDTSLHAALWAADLAHRMQVPLVLAHAMLIPSYYYANPMLFSLDTFDSDALEAAGSKRIAVVESAVRNKFPDLDLSTWNRYSPPDLALVGWSRRAQLIVVGAHRHVSTSSVLLGSTTMRVVNHCESPVAVWRGEPGDGPVVVGVDGSPLSMVAIERAFDLASRYGTGVRAVHAWYPGVIAGETIDTSAPDALLAESLAGWSEKYPDVEVTRVLEAAPPEEAILRQAQDACLVVVGSHGRGRASSLLLGSTSRYLLGRSPCPVLVCRTEFEGLA